MIKDLATPPTPEEAAAFRKEQEKSFEEYKDLEILNKAIKQAEKNGYKFNLFSFINPKKAVIGIMFSHDFAKAFWGEEKIAIPPDEYYWFPKWQYHLQQMVLKKNPFLYFKEFLE